MANKRKSISAVKVDEAAAATPPTTPNKKVKKDTPAKTPRTPLVKTPAVNKTPGVKTPAVKTPAVKNPGVKTPGVKTPGVKTPGVKTPGVKTPGVTTPAAKTPGVKTPGVKTPGVKTPGVKTPGVKTPAAKKKKTRRRKGKKANTKTDLPNGAGQAGISNAHYSANAIAYLESWKNDRPKWKYVKKQQHWLAINLTNAEQVPDEYFEIALEYFENAKGNIHTLMAERVQRKCDALKKKDKLDQKISDRIERVMKLCKAKGVDQPVPIKKDQKKKSKKQAKKGKGKQVEPKEDENDSEGEKEEEDSKEGSDAEDGDE